MIILKSLFSIIKDKRKSAKNELEVEKSILFDGYTIVLIGILIANVLLNIFLKQFLVSSLFFGLSLFMACTLLWPDRIRFNKNLLMLLFFFLGLIIFFFDGLSGAESMNYLSYISLTIAVSFFFDFKKDKYIIFALILSYIAWFLTNITTDYSLFSSLKRNFTNENQFYIRTYKVMEISFCTFVGMYFIYRKEKMILKYHIETEKLNELLKKTDRVSFSGELYELAMSKNSLFITYFKSEFPDFFEKILEVSPNLISSELEICALLKLNLSTKEISTATNSTIRAVENKKYRIRRKLNVPTETDLNLYIINTF